MIKVTIEIICHPVVKINDLLKKVVFSWKIFRLLLKINTLESC